MKINRANVSCNQSTIEKEKRKTSTEVLTMILDNSPVPQQHLFSPPRLRIIPPRQPLFIKTCCASSPGSSSTSITCQINLFNFSPAS
ncbi:hypothetical protein AMECASPLE_037215 [Ameca splendens]|uniref:Uncharacterized protein n=1 Tax=Ameca splendens TaxID=208324 RepID=A0ABV0ZU01_9TELE